ncbi:hypothetical protein Pint_08848 [Pistacia integerrima]|uniref:Uncharacterized protein n=1 Tax=Pistacia integerrima TaxID=434235 RepID=A0ACC0XWW4_9ROSI|nr:hypothetical protein Pint_08848 [Pistacia integerrima]
MNASVNIFRLAEEEWMINTWGDISHLSETGYLETAFGGDKTSDWAFVHFEWLSACTYTIVKVTSRLKLVIAG